MKRQRLGEEDNLAAFFPFLSTTPLHYPLYYYPEAIVWENKWNDCLLSFVRTGGVEVVVMGRSVQNLNANLAIQCTQATAASRIVQILMHGRDQIKIYQLRVGIHLQIHFHRMKN